MRSLASDRGRTIPIVSAIVPGSAASGGGVFSDGTPWVMTRTATGFYKINFDTRFIPIGGSGQAMSNPLLCSIYAYTPGQILLLIADLGGIAQNSDFRLLLNWLDTRV